MKEIKTKLTELFQEQKRLSGELSKLNLAFIDAEKRVELIDREIGHGHRRVDELAQAKDELETIRDERNKTNGDYFKALEEYESFHRSSMPELFQSVIDSFDEIQPLHYELMKKINDWRDGLSFVNRFYIGRGVRKDFGFFVPENQPLPNSIFTDEDINAVDVLKKILSGSITLTDRDPSVFSKVQKRKRGSIYG
jgi:hypothetical protein